MLFTVLYTDISTTINLVRVFVFLFSLLSLLLPSTIQICPTLLSCVTELPSYYLPALYCFTGLLIPPQFFAPAYPGAPRTDQTDHYHSSLAGDHPSTRLVLS